MDTESVRKIVTEFKSFVSDLFPVNCDHCGKEYRNLSEFMELVKERQEAASDFGIVDPETAGDAINDQEAICECGKPLKIFFKDRRDTTEKGLKFRDQFGEVMNQLEEAGVEKNQARQQLLLILHGQEGDLISQINIETGGNTDRWYKEDEDTSGNTHLL